MRCFFLGLVDSDEGASIEGGTDSSFERTWVGENSCWVQDEGGCSSDDRGGVGYAAFAWVREKVRSAISPMRLRFLELSPENVREII